MAASGIAEPNRGLGPDRQVSGLVMSFGSFGAFLFGIHCISLSSSGLIPFSWVASAWPGADIIAVLFLAAGFCLIHGGSYAVIGSTVPMAGADYVFASRVFPPALAFAASWTLVLFSGIVAGGLAAWIPQSAIPSLFRPIAIIFESPRYSAVADFSSSFVGSMLIGSAVILLVVFSISTSNLNVQRVLALGFVLGVVAWVLIYSSLLTGSSSDFQVAWNKFMGPTSSFGDYSMRVELAKRAGMKVSDSWFQMTLAGLIMGFWIFYGYYIPTFFSEEVRRPAKTLFVASASSILVSLLVFGLATFLLERVTDETWIAAEGFIFNNPGDVERVTGGEKVAAMPWITFYAAILQPRAWVIFLVAFGWIFTLINLVQTYFFYSSRVILSWALDRIVPNWIAKLDETTRAPRNAIRVIAVLAFVGLYDASTGGPLGTQMTFAFFAVTTQLVPIAALVALPTLRPELYSQAPPFVRRKLLGVPILVILGTATLLYLIWMIAASFLYPAVGIKNPILTVTLLTSMMITGVIWFYAMRYFRRKTEGIDILLTYRRPLPRLAEPEFD